VEGKVKNKNRYGNRIARRIFRKKGFCETCQTKKATDIHHKDENILNNKPENLQEICRSCHMKLHKLRLENPDCRLCGQELIINQTWYASSAKFYDNICIQCLKKRARRYDPIYKARHREELREKCRQYRIKKKLENLNVNAQGV